MFKKQMSSHLPSTQGEPNAISPLPPLLYVRSWEWLVPWRQKWRDFLMTELSSFWLLICGRKRALKDSPPWALSNPQVRMFITLAEILLLNSSLVNMLWFFRPLSSKCTWSSCSFGYPISSCCRRCRRTDCYSWPHRGRELRSVG